MNILRATVRLQFNHAFTFDHAAACVDYYARLGISHYYASPIYTARKGSMHGYDVVDFAEVNPELGGETGLRAMVARLRERGMGLVVDLVPNHMAVGEADNRWWLDLLEHGEASAYAPYFDIDWNPPDASLRGKLLAPFLGKPYEQALADGDLKLGHDEAPVGFHVDYGPHRFPIASADHAAIVSEGGLEFYNDDREGAARLDRLLSRQHYRLADWREASRSINWRRFFDVTSLAAIRADRDEVFEATHAMPLRLYAEGLIDGFRIDHIDGLADPAHYLARLRERLDALHAERPQEFALETPWLVVEKILARGERLRADWQADGATGYKFMDAVSGLLHDPAGEAPLTALWRGFTGERSSADTEAYRARKELAEGSFAAELDALSALLLNYATAADGSAAIDGAALRAALLEFLAHFPIYRSYVSAEEAGAQDRAIYRHTLETLREHRAAPGADALAVLEAWIESALSELPAEPDEAEQRAHVALQRLQKLLPALDAKSVEDTVFYRYGRLLSRNEVGSWPGQFAVTPDAFHALNLDRALRLPRSMIATATHDQKRGEDQRMRLAALSEFAAQWTEAVHRLQALTAPLRSAADAPSPADELMLYQTLVGAWPHGLDGDDRPALAAFGERIAGWQQKAMREAKLRTSWTAPVAAYEDASRAFLDALLGHREAVAELRAFAARVAPYGALNSLSQTLLRLTVPGVPDLYQGAEFWDLSLVDPDNRRPVDYERRLLALESAQPPGRLLAEWPDARVKQALIAAALDLRSEIPELFERGAYEYLSLLGPLAGHALAFVRRDAKDVVIVIVTRLAAGVDAALSRPQIAAERWGKTSVLLPADAPAQLIDALGGALGGEPIRVGEGGRLLLAEALATLPVALLRYRL